MRPFFHFALAVIFLATAVAAPVMAAEPFTLQSVRALVKQKYANVTPLSTKDLADMLAGKEHLLILDVREQEEYAVSHIPGAVRVDPSVWSWSFMQRFAAQARARKVIFYCSVGERSSRLAAAVQDGLKAQGAIGVYNLDGGIFAWHNESRPLADRKGATRFIHPFDAHWGSLVERKGLLRTAPGS